MADLWETLKERPTGKALRLLVEALVLRSLKESLRGVYLRGEAPEGPLVLALNHHGFFDGHLAWLLGKLCRRPLSLLVAEENLRAYPVLKLAGALGREGSGRPCEGSGGGSGWPSSPRGRCATLGPWGPFGRGQLACAESGGPPPPRGPKGGPPGIRAPRGLPLGGQAPSSWRGPGEGLGGLLQALDALLAKTHPREVPEGFREVLRGRRSLEERVLPLVRLLRP